MNQMSIKVLKEKRIKEKKKEIHGKSTNISEGKDHFDKIENRRSL